MPRASRTSQAALANSFHLEDTLGVGLVGAVHSQGTAPYMLPSLSASTSASASNNATNNAPIPGPSSTTMMTMMMPGLDGPPTSEVDDSMLWAQHRGGNGNGNRNTRRGGRGNNAASNTAELRTRRSARNAASSLNSAAAGARGAAEGTDLSISSASASTSIASLNSPMNSSHAPSEASSYALRVIPGVVDEGDDDDDDNEVQITTQIGGRIMQSRRGHEDDEDDEDDDDDEEEDEVVVRASTSSATTAERRRRIRPRGNSDRNHEVPRATRANSQEWPHEHVGEEEGGDDTHSSSHHHHHHQQHAHSHNHSRTYNSSTFSSRLLEDSEDDYTSSHPNSHTHIHSTSSAGASGHVNAAAETDSMYDATEEEVENRALMELGLLEMDSMDRELFVVDLGRWKEAVSVEKLGKEKENGSVEFKQLQQIQAELLKKVQDLENSEWMYPEPIPFHSNLPLPGATIGHKQQGELPFIQNILNNGSSSLSWTDLAFNPLSTFTPLAPAGQASYPDIYRVQRALGAIPAPSSSSLSSVHAPSTTFTAVPNPQSPAMQHDSSQQQQQQQARLAANDSFTTNTARAPAPEAATPLPYGIPRRKPDLSFLDAQARDLLIDQEKSFAATSNFPWAASLSTTSTGRQDSTPGHAPSASASSEMMQKNKNARNSSLMQGSSSSLTREVGIITL